MEKEEETMAPVKTGMAVYALFKWLALTLRQDENKDIYTFPFHAIQEYNLDNVGSELNYHRFVSRIRRYAAEHLSLPSKRMPLFIHAIGLLDAFMLVQCFKQWQKIYKRNKQLDDYFIVNYCRLLLRSWARKTACKKRLQRAASLVHLKTQVRSIMHFFYLWRRNYHNNRMVRKHWLPRRRALAFEEFSQRVNKIKIGRCQFHLSICHHVTYRLGHYFGLLRSQRCALSGATELIASIAVIDLIVQAIKSQNLGFDYLVHRSESRIYERQRFFRILLNSWQDRSTPSTTSATKKTGGIYQIIRILHTELHSRQGRQALELLGDRYYRARCRQRAMRQWLARHIQCVVDYHHIAQSSPITMDISNETMQRLNSHFLHLPRAHLYGPRYFEANKFRLTKQLSYLFHKWWRRHQVQSYQEYAFHKVYRRTMTQIQGQAFANWLILAAKNRVYRQVSHQILHKTYYRRLLVSFYQWRNQYERMVLIKTNQKELLRQRDQEVKSFTALMTQKHHHHLKYAILRSWFLFVKDRNKGKRVLLLWLKYANAAKVRAAWTCWKTVTSLATIVTCMKKLWLGYRTRFLSHGRIYQYMRWYRQQYRLLQCFQRRWNKKKVWSVFQKYRLLLDHEFIKKRYERNIYRAFKKFFQFYRQRRLKHQVERKGMAYFQHTRPQLLLQRWKQRVVAGRLFHHTHLQYYRQLLSRTLRRLQANAKYYHRQYLAYRMGKEKVWWYFLAKINQRLDQRMLQRLGRVHERHRVLKPCLQFWYAWSQRRCRALYYRRKSLYRRRRGYFLQWKEQMQCKAQQRQISQLFHAKMSQWRYLHHWQDYLQNSVYHKVWKGVQKHEKDRHFGYQPNTANSSRYRFLTFPATQRPNSKLPMNLTYYPSLIQGCIAHYFRRAFHHYHQHALVLRSLRKSMLRAGHHHHRYQLRRAFGYFWAQYKRASMRPGYEKKRLIPSRFGAGSGGSSGLGGVGRMYLHLRHGNYGGARRIQRLRRLWYDDPHQSSQLFYRLMKWQSFVQQRKKRQGNYKKLFRIYRREQMNRIFWKVLIRLRKLRKHRKILHNIYKYYFTNHVKLFFTRILERLKNKRWKRKRIMDHHYQRMRNVYKLCFRQLRSLTAQHCKTRKSFKFIRKLLIGSRLFFQRLRSKVYKNRYDRVTRIVQAKFRRHILRSFILFQRRLLQQQRQRQVKKLTAKNHQLNEKKKALVHWRVIALYQKKIQKINRRFLLVPYLKRWMEEYQLSNRYHKILSIMSKKVNTRIKSTFWIYWKIYITRKMRLSLQYNLVWKEHQLRAKHNVLTAWMSAMDNRLVYQKYLLVHALHAKHLKAFVLKEWYHLTLRHEIINFKNMKAVMVNWRYNLQRYRQQREHMQLANIFHYNRLVYKSFQVLRRQVRLRHRWQQREEYALRRSLRRLYLKYFRQWKRHMYIIYYHERKQRPSSTTRLPGSHLLGEKTSTAAVNMNEPRKHVWMSDVDDREGNGANNDSLHRSARRGRHKHYDRHDEDSQTGRGTMRASSLLRSRPDPHLTSRDTSTASATFNNRSMFSNSQQGGLRSPTAVHNTMEDGGGRGLSLSHLAATAASPLPRPRPRSSSHSHARPSSSNRQHHSSSPSRPFSPARVAHVLEQHDPPNAHYHHRLQQRYARLSRYQRLLQYDCDVSLWQPYRLFVHWRRLTAFRKRLRADLMVKRLFFMWKYYIRIYSLKKQAFLSRLAALHRRRQLLLVWRPLHDHHKLLVNARYLMYCQQKRRITKAFHFWSRCLENRFAVQKKLTDVMTAIYFNQKRRLFMTWKVKVRHMERLFRSQVVKYTFKAWRKCYLSRVYYRLVLKNKMFLVWKEVIQVNRTVYSLYLLRRQKLANLLHRWNCQTRLWVRLAFNTWKFKPLHDCTLRQYIHLLNSQYDPDSIRILVGQGQGSAQENIFREIYRAMEAVNGQLEQRYQHGLMQAEIAKSQAGRYLLFPQEELELIQEDLSARRGGVQIPRHLEILRSFWQQCHDATVKREVKKRKTPRKNSENMTIKSLREAMYEVVNERQVSSHSLTPSKLSYRQIPSPARFVAIPSPQAKTRMMQSAMNRSISESKGADFALSPHPDRLNALATPSTSINAFSATKLGGGLHLADIM